MDGFSGHPEVKKCLIWVNMQFSGLNKIHSQLTAYTGQSVHAVS